MARIIRTNGEQVEVQPLNGTDFSLEELKAIVNGWVEIVWLPNDEIMVINEEGKLLELPMNAIATDIYHNCFGFSDIIVGDVLLCNSNQVK